MAGAAARSKLPLRDASYFDRGMGGSRLSLVGAVGSAVAAVDALDPQTLSPAAGDREAALADQSTADGPATESAEDAAAPASVRAHQAGLSAQAPHSGENRPLGCRESGLHGSRFGFAF